MNQDEKLALQMLNKTVDNFIRESRDEWVKTDARMDKMQKQLDLYATIIKLAKFGATVVVLILSLKLGDVRALWEEFFN